MRKIVFPIAIAAFVLTACSTTTPTTYLDKGKPELISKEMVGNFCSTGTERNLGGMAVAMNVTQQAIGNCKHPKWQSGDIIVLYFGDDGEQAPKEYLDEELDSQIHPDNYLTAAEIAEIECTDGSQCRFNKSLFGKGVVVHFAPDSDVPINATEVELVERMGHIARDKHVVLAVTGYTDSTASETHNMPLSQRRAFAVRKILNASGINSNLVEIAGRSSTSPVASNETNEGRALNRRTEVMKKN